MSTISENFYINNDKWYFPKIFLRTQFIGLLAGHTPFRRWSTQWVPSKMKNYASRGQLADKDEEQEEEEEEDEDEDEESSVR